MGRVGNAVVVVSSMLAGLLVVSCKGSSASAQTASASAAYAEVQGVGERYGSHNPRTCPAGSLTGGSAPTLTQATMSVVCSMEGVTTNSELILITEVAVQIGGGRSYNQSNLTNATDADVKAMVYPIRGSFKRYDCAPLPPRGIYPPGQQCTMYPHTNATGMCYKNTFGDWACTMSGSAITANQNAQTKIPPPTAQ
jgi:hypothetical protein